MKKIRLLYGAAISSAFASFCLILLSISCSKEQSTIAPPPPPPPPPPAPISISLFAGQIPNDSTLNDALGNGNGIEVGMKFRTNVAGTIDGLKFYKTLGNAGEHTAYLYSADGTELASAAFVNETDSGWQTVLWSQPVSISANITYVAAYYSSLGNYVSTDYGLKNAISNSVITALADSTDGVNGLFIYTNSPKMPDQGYLSGNYWVDVILTYLKAE